MAGKVSFRTEEPVAMETVKPSGDRLSYVMEDGSVNGDMLHTGFTNPKKKNFDVFLNTEREFDNEADFFSYALKFSRLVLPPLLCVVMVAGLVASRMSMLVLSANINSLDEATSTTTAPSLLLLCMCVPFGFNWVGSFFRVAFSKQKWPNFSIVLCTVLTENAHVIGLSLLLFRVLPRTDMFHDSILLLAIFPIPAILRLVTEAKQKPMTLTRIAVVSMTSCAMLVQLAATIIFPSYHDDLIPSDVTKIVSIHELGNVTGLNETESVSQDVIDVQLQLNECKVPTWEFVLACFLITFGHWQNFLFDTWNVSAVSFKFHDWKARLRETHDTTMFMVGWVKIATAIICCILLLGVNDTFHLPDLSNTLGATWTEKHLAHYGLVYIQITTGFLCTYLSAVACKINMQIIAFCIPIISTPIVTTILIFCHCKYNFLPTLWHAQSWYCPISESDVWQPFIAGLILVISYAVIVSYIWFPKNKIMTRTENLFISRMYDGILPDVTLSLSRRQDDKEVLEQYQTQDTSSTGPPLVHVCATMWHETRQEMTALLKSLFRMDMAHCQSTLANKFDVVDPDFYNLDIHIMFDDAFELDKVMGRYVPNSFVRQLCKCVDQAARSIVKGDIVMDPAVKTPTPYGGQLTWTMPGGTKMVAHLKNKNFIRHKKRWSQVMYLYYLLGYKLLNQSDNSENIRMDQNGDKKSHVSKLRQRKKRHGRMAIRSTLFKRIDSIDLQRAENTYLLALDGDVNFKPDAIKLLIDAMKKDPKVGAACGRIHPIGSGPMVWYQQFEYAIGHWLQKAAENVFGCVLCCPGCFSLYRASALMDDNVMCMYTTRATGAWEYIQYDQGEDRWLSTLLIQQGYKIVYEAGADALTYAPETLDEFFNQRRRWSPSTLANIIDVLSNWKDTVRVNDNISTLFILYQFVLTASTILGPSTVILMIHGSLINILKLGQWWAYVLALLPAVFYTVVCYTLNTKRQLQIATLLTVFYTVVMMVVTVGTIYDLSQHNYQSPNVVFLGMIVIVMFTAGLLHPQEFFCLIHGTIYFLTVPSTYIVLTIYYLCNLNCISWGTREVYVPKEPTTENAKSVEVKKPKGLVNWLGLAALLEDIKEWLKPADIINKPAAVSCQETQTDATSECKEITQMNNNDEVDKHSIDTMVVSKDVVESEDELKTTGWEPDPKNPHWLQLDTTGNGEIRYLDENEKYFWDCMLKKYLHPLDEDKTLQAKITYDLAKLKNNIVVAFMLVNFLWTVITVHIYQLQSELKNVFIYGKYQPLALAFMAIFAFVLILQFISMLIHRWETFLHLVSNTTVNLFGCFSKKPSEEDIRDYIMSTLKKLSEDDDVEVYDTNTTNSVDNDDCESDADSTSNSSTLSGDLILDEQNTSELAKRIEKNFRRMTTRRTCRRSQSMSPHHHHHHTRTQSMRNEMLKRSTTIRNTRVSKTRQRKPRVGEAYTRQWSDQVDELYARQRNMLTDESDVTDERYTTLDFANNRDAGNGVHSKDNVSIHSFGFVNESHDAVELSEPIEETGNKIPTPPVLFSGSVVIDIDNETQTDVTVSRETHL